MRIPMILRASIGLVLAALLSAPMAAQGTIKGTVHDSLRTKAPIKDAEVVLLGANRKVRTDDRGRFEFTDLPAGKHTVAFWAPWLDSLALPPMQREVELGRRDLTVNLATPSAASYQRAACGTTLEPEQGVLVGEIRGPDGSPMADVGVATRWTETRIGVGQFERLLVAAVDTSNAAGLYAICGVPVGSEIALRAIGQDGVGSNEIIQMIDALVQRRDLGVGPREVVSRLTGRVLRPDGSPLAGATVAIAGDTSLFSTASDDGRFVLENVPRRSSQLIARALGHVPTTTTVELFASDVEIDDVKLERIPQELEAVTVTGSGPMTAGRLQFENRKSKGIGSFLSDADLERIPNISSSIVASMVPRTAAQAGSRGAQLMIRRGAGFCRPRFYVDGYDNGNLSPEEEGTLMQRAKRIEVYTANDTPPQFNDFDGCGAVVIWTR